MNTTWWADKIYTRVNVVLSWTDRFKVLFRGELDFDVETKCEVAPGRVESETLCHVPPLIRKSTSMVSPGSDNKEFLRRMKIHEQDKIQMDKVQKEFLKK